MRTKFQKTLIALVLLFVSMSLIASGQQIVFNKILPEDAPNFGAVGRITQDKNGTMWFATKTGLYSYDGNQMTSFRNNPSDPNYIHKPMVIMKTSYLPPSGGTRGACLVSVHDNGPGIPSRIVDKIFQPFFTTKPTGQGTGLGLSLSYDIVKAHGGELIVETKEGEGSEFIIQLPMF